MKMVFHTEEPEDSMVYENLRDVSSRIVALKSRSGEDRKVTAAVPGIKLYRLLAVSFGLLCILQAALNIYLCIGLFTGASCKNLTEERDELRSVNYGIEASLKTLTEERDKLKSIVYDTEARCQNLAEERDELKRTLNNFVTQKNSQTEARDTFKRELENFEWIHIGDSLYHISSREKTWQGSRNDCLQKGADLMIINCKQEQNFLRQFKKYMWIGLTDSQTEGTWKWVDGTPLTTSYWDPREPNGGTNENCGEIKYYDVENSWNDEGCSASHFWICEKKAPQY